MCNLLLLHRDFAGDAASSMYPQGGLVRFRAPASLEAYTPGSQSSSVGSDASTSSMKGRTGSESYDLGVWGLRVEGFTGSGFRALCSQTSEVDQPIRRSKCRSFLHSPRPPKSETRESPVCGHKFKATATGLNLRTSLATTSSLLTRGQVQLPKSVHKS